MAQSIQIKCEGSRTLPVSELRPFQGNLKTLTEANFIKLKGLILSQGFSFPIFVWNDRENNQTYIIDGHQRVRTLSKLVEEGYTVPNVPVADVQAQTFSEAKKKLLAAASQFGDVDQQGLYEFVIDNDFDPGFLEENFKLPEVNMKQFTQGFFGEGANNTDTDSKEYDQDDFDKFDTVCPKCGFEFNAKAGMDAKGPQGDTKD